MASWSNQGRNSFRSMDSRRREDIFLWSANLSFLPTKNLSLITVHFPFDIYLILHLDFKLTLDFLPSVEPCFHRRQKSVLF